MKTRCVNCDRKIDRDPAAEYAVCSIECLAAHEARLERAKVYVADRRDAHFDLDRRVDEACENVDAFLRDLHRLRACDTVDALMAV